MADISKEINDFKNAIYGEEVRGSMITLAEKVNTEVETNTTNVNAAVSTANTASGKANQTLETAQEAINEAETTLQAANTAKADAQSSAEAAAASASAAEASKTATAQSAAAAAASAAEAEQVAEGLGGFNGSAASVTAVDTQGMVVETGENTNAQALFNALALKVAQELVSNEELAQQLASYVAKTDIVQTESTATNKVPSSAYLKTVKDTINSNFDKYYSLSAAIQIPSGADLNNYTDFGNYVSLAASISSTLQNCPALNGGFVLHVERVTGATDGTFLKQRIVYNEAKSLEYWRVKTGEESWGTWVSPITNADYEAQTITNSYGLTIILYTFGNDSIKALKMQGYINKALTVGTEYTLATNAILKSRVNWYHNVLFGGKSKNSICYLSIDTSGNFKITPQAAVASGDAMSIMEYYV